jgi:DNA-binding transcriptional ArsR family regulator
LDASQDVLVPRKRDDLAGVWKALASPVRRAILDDLRDGPRTTGALAERFPKLTRFAVMQHLRVLEEAELVIPRRDGRERYNYLNPVPIQRVFDRWVSRYMKPWTEALVSLRAELETQSRKERA